MLPDESSRKKNLDNLGSFFNMCMHVAMCVQTCMYMCGHICGGQGTMSAIINHGSLSFLRQGFALDWI